MIEKTIAEIEARITRARSISERTKASLLKELAILKIEVADLAKTHEEQAESITRFAQASTHEATREQKDQELLDISLKGFSSSVKEFENSHPTLVQTANRIAQALANMGI